MEKKKWKQAEKRGKETLEEAKSYHESELENKPQFLATLHSLLGSCMLEQGKFAPAEANFLKDYEISEEMLVDKKLLSGLYFPKTQKIPKFARFYD